MNSFSCAGFAFASLWSYDRNMHERPVLRGPLPALNPSATIVSTYVESFRDEKIAYGNHLLHIVFNVMCIICPFEDKTSHQQCMRRHHTAVSWCNHLTRWYSINKITNSDSSSSVTVLAGFWRIIYWSMNMKKCLLTLLTWTHHFNFLKLTTLLEMPLLLIYKSNDWSWT